MRKVQPNRAREYHQVYRINPLKLAVQLQFEDIHSSCMQAKNGAVDQFDFVDRDHAGNQKRGENHSHQDEAHMLERHWERVELKI